MNMSVNNADVQSIETTVMTIIPFAKSVETADGMLFVKFAEVSLTRYGMTITKIVTIIMSVKIVGNTQIGMYVTDAII